MNVEKCSRGVIVPALCAILLVSAGCQKKQEPASEGGVAEIDRVGKPPSGGNQAVLHKTFTVRNTVAFPFEIPAHSALPHLRGNFKSYVTKLGIQSSEHSADVDFLVLTEEQYANFTHRGGSDEVFYSAKGSNDQSVDLSIPPALDHGAKYYLVFRNTPGGDTRKTVQADLTLDF
jgi:hypothetical protein